MTSSEPYLFEPEDKSEDWVERQLATNDDDKSAPFTPSSHTQRTITNMSRVGNTSCCTCAKCISMPSQEESVCCLEIDECRAKLDISLDCITSNHNFQVVCLNVEVLYTALVAMYDTWRDPIPTPISNRLDSNLVL